MTFDADATFGVRAAPPLAAAQQTAAQARKALGPGEDGGGKVTEGPQGSLLSKPAGGALAHLAWQEQLSLRYQPQRSANKYKHIIHNLILPFSGHLPLPKACSCQPLPTWYPPTEAA